ncbi:Ff.00g066780.m01.CDS01 [Fusarium sp. VM40]|nr:Ff.00g066780.m01.CDS01 [Fusarium sp. VM40]
MTQPYPPGDREAATYYYGISSCPRLVARTSSEPFVLRIEMQHPVPKRFDPVGSHKIVSLWNNTLWNNSGPLRTQILEVVEELQWNVIDILRLGYEPDDKQVLLPVTMLISIDNGSTDWSTAIRVALRCREILCRHGVEIEVEIKESCIFPAVGHHPLTSDPVEEPEEATIHHSEMIGTSIAAGKDPEIERTKGAYLRLKDSGDILSLTCRHVIFNGEPNLEYRHKDSAPRTVIQPGNETLKAGIKDVKLELVIIEKLADKAREKDFDTNATKKKRLEALLARLEKMGPRTIGHVRFSPKYEFTESQAGLRRFRDWALIELHQDMHQTPIKALKNVVWAEDRRKTFLLMAGNSRKSVKELPFTIQYEGDNRVKLEGHFTEAELEKPQFESPGPDPDLDAMVVAKYGKTTGYSSGLRNTVLSVLRNPPAGGIQGTSDEWCIIGAIDCGGRRFTFSNKGDSGACIWDMHGRVVGMIIAGVGSQEAREQTFDATYVTPMD